MMKKTDKKSKNRPNEFTDEEKIEYLTKVLKPTDEDRLPLFYYENHTLVSLNYICARLCGSKKMIWDRLFEDPEKRPAKICSMGDDLYADIDYVIDCLKRGSGSL